MMSIDRVNDNLNAIGDSSKLGFEVVDMGRNVDKITNNVSIIRKNMRGRSAAFNIKNLYLYQSFIAELNYENDQIESHTAKLYDRVYTAKLSMKTVLSDSVFHLLYANSAIHKTLERKLVRVERKWYRTDSITKANVDTLNTLKVKIADNAVNLSNMLNMMDTRLDRADKQLFGQEVNYLWQKGISTGLVQTNPSPPNSNVNRPSGKDSKSSPSTVTSKALTSTRTRDNPSANVVKTKLGSERSAISFYYDQTSRQRASIIILGVLIFIWLFNKRKLLKDSRDPDGSSAFLHLQYLNKYPVLSVLVVLLCLTPFFDAYAPTSYIAIEYLLLLIILSVVLFRKEGLAFFFDWMILVGLFMIDTLTYLLVEPSFVSRLWIIAVQGAIMVFSFLFYNKLNHNIPFYKWIKRAVIIGILLSGLGILSNLLGRFSLSGIFGISAIFAVTQVFVLGVFIEIIIEIILVQLQGSRLKKGLVSPFDRSLIVNKVRNPLVILAMFLWVTMLASNLNIYHSIKNSIFNFLTTPLSVGSISFSLINVLYFFAIIWFAHILQQLISFLFGDTGIESEDITADSKKHHSQLLITRLLVLIGGYLLAIAASGLPLDKITILLGALGVGIGMGLQNVVNNFVSGIILIFNGSFKIGDEIEVSGQAGKVKEIGLRASTLTTPDGADVIIPNGNILSQNIVNWTFTNDLKRVMIGFVLSGKELDANLINEVINETIKNVPGVISLKKPVILYTKVTQDNCSLTVRFWSTINNADHTKSEAVLQLSTAFADKKIQFE